MTKFNRSNVSVLFCIKGKLQVFVDESIILDVKLFSSSLFFIIHMY